MIKPNIITIALLVTFISAPNSFAQKPADLELKFKREVFEDAKVEITTSQLVNYQRDREKELNESRKTIDIPCNITINKPVDKRLNKEFLGVNWQDQSVTTKYSVVDWLEDALIGMKELGHKTQLENGSINSNDIRVATNLRRMYVWHYSRMYFGTLSFETTFEHPQLQEPVTKFYRVSGYHPSSYANAMNRAVNRLIDRVSEDLIATCNASI